jgi:hypothetical protein
MRGKKFISLRRKIQADSEHKPTCWPVGIECYFPGGNETKTRDSEYLQLHLHPQTRLYGVDLKHRGNSADIQPLQPSNIYFTSYFLQRYRHKDEELRIGRSRVRIPGGWRDFSLVQNRPHPLSWPKQPRSRRVPGSPSRRYSGLSVSYSTPSSA